MKMKKSRLLAVTLLLIAFVMAICAFFTGNSYTAQAASDPYAFEVGKYNLTYDISSDCSMDVTEDITINYMGYSSTGFLRDIPINDGAMVQNISVKKLVDGTPEKVYYNVFSEDINYITVDIGDSTNKYNKSETYRITYKYIISNKVVDNGTLPLNAVGTGWQCALNDVSVKLILPKGYKSAKCYSGIVYTHDEHPFEESVNSDGRTVITTYAERLRNYTGITFYLNFEDGAIKSYTDLTPYIVVGAGVILVLIIIMLRLFVFNKGTVLPVVNFEAPDEMDPLLMGKLIDNRVDNEDITSLIYYFADKGYLKINLDDKDDPTLIRTVKNLPSTASEHEKIMFNGLFGKGDMIKPSELKYSFYRTMEKVTATVNSKTKGLYTSTSMGVSMLLALCGGLVAALAPIILVLTRISSTYFTILPLIVLVPMLIIYALSEQVKFNQIKYNASKKALYWVIIAAVCALTCLIYTFLVPDYIMGKLPKALICAVSCIAVIISAFMINRTDAHAKQLGEIVGFRNFILLAEKDQLEKMLEENPDFYFHVLPYAQVLGVSDKWEEKFKDITVQPPRWATSNGGVSWFDFVVINSCIRHSMGRMTANMVSRPSSSGVNGGGRGFGGGGGGFSGGGFGGGGGRGR